MKSRAQEWHEHCTVSTVETIVPLAACATSIAFAYLIVRSALAGILWLTKLDVDRARGRTERARRA